MQPLHIEPQVYAYLTNDKINLVLQLLYQTLGLPYQEPQPLFYNSLINDKLFDFVSRANDALIQSSLAPLPFLTNTEYALGEDYVFKLVINRINAILEAHEPVLETEF